MNDGTVNLRSLEYFLAIYECGSLGKASANMGISQPALSKNLRHLEETLGISLFKRSPAGVAPTMYAHMLEQHSRAIGGHYEAIHRNIRALNNARKGVVRLGANTGSALRIVPHALTRLTSEYPEIRVRFIEGRYEYLAEQLIKMRLDIAIVSEPAGRISEHLHGDHFAADPFFIAMGAKHPLRCMGADFPLECFFNYPWIFPSGPVESKIVAAFRALGFEAPAPRIRTSSISCIKEMLLTQNFLSFVPQSFCDAMASLQEFHLLERPEFRLGRTLIVLRRSKEQLTPSSLACIAALRASCALLSTRLPSFEELGA